MSSFCTKPFNLLLDFVQLSLQRHSVDEVIRLQASYESLNAGLSGKVVLDVSFPLLLFSQWTFYDKAIPHAGINFATG